MVMQSMLTPHLETSKTGKKSIKLHQIVFHGNTKCCRNVASISQSFTSKYLYEIFTVAMRLHFSKSYSVQFFKNGWGHMLVEKVFVTYT